MWPKLVVGDRAKAADVGRESPSAGRPYRRTLRKRVARPAPTMVIRLPAHPPLLKDRRMFTADTVLPPSLAPACSGRGRQQQSGRARRLSPRRS